MNEILHLLVLFHPGLCPRMNMSRVLLFGSHVKGVQEVRKLKM